MYIFIFLPNSQIVTGHRCRINISALIIKLWMIQISARSLRSEADSLSEEEEAEVRAQRESADLGAGMEVMLHHICGFPLFCLV